MLTAYPKRLSASPAAVAALASAILFALYPAKASSNTQDSAHPVKELSLEQLGDVQVTTLSQEPEEAWKTRDLRDYAGGCWAFRRHQYSRWDAARSLGRKPPELIQ